MSDSDDLDFSPDEFAGTVRLFPLPNVVLFPHVMLPLHIFEPRYRDLMRDALQSDRLLAMALLKPGWEPDYEGRAPLHPVACLGRITTYHRLSDGRYNVLLFGLRRVRLLEELPPIHRYREARVELCAAGSTAEPAPTGPVQARLRELVMNILPRLPEAGEQLEQLLGNDVSLAVLTDVISFALDIDVADKQALLSEWDVGRRAATLTGHLTKVAEGDRPGHLSPIAFPPTFNPN